MKEIKEKLIGFNTETLKEMFYEFRRNNDEGSILVFNCIVDILEERIGDKVWDM